MASLLGGHRPYRHLGGDQETDHGKRRDEVIRWGVVAVAALTLLVVGVLAAVVALTSTWGPGGTPLPLGGASSAAFEEALVVRTNCGEFVGTIEDGAFAFKGIPYARPPVGHLRWKKPVACWSAGASNRGRRRAHRPAPPCFHLHPETGRPIGSEDCLFLDVWSPRLDSSAGLAVLVWVQGGEIGGLGPSGRLASKLGLVLVSLQHRLGPLGFAALQALQERPGRDARGNYALWDALTALQWVKLNIRVFGGDPEKVTASGADAGASMVRVLAGRRLFRASWLLGPAATAGLSFEAASGRDDALFGGEACDAACLRRLSPEGVFRAALGAEGEAPAQRIRDRNDLPVRGILPRQAIVVDGELFSSATDVNTFEDVPSLVGSAAEATDWWPGPDDLASWDWPRLAKYVSTSLDSFGPGVGRTALRLYNASDTRTQGGPWSPDEVFNSMVSDVRQTCPVHHMSGNSSSPVYRYIVTHRPSAPVKLFGGHASHLSFHAWDAIAFFDHLEHFLPEPRPEDLRFRDALHRTVASFVRSGGRAPPWGPYPGAVAIFGRNGTVGHADGYREEQCHFWHHAGLDEYAWVS